MYKDLKFPVLIVHRDIKADTVAGERVREIAAELCLLYTSPSPRDS